MPMRLRHDRKNLADVFDGNVLVKEIAHRVDEDSLRLLPSQRKLEHVWLKGHLKAVNVVGLAHGLQPLGHPLGVTVLTARADFGTAGYGVPGRFGPFDGGVKRH